jgi:hypothetical protein
MLKIRDFQCPDGHTQEYFVSDDVVLTRCECGKDAKRVISPIRSVLEPQSSLSLHRSKLNKLKPYLRSTEVSLLQNLHVCTKKLRSY